MSSLIEDGASDIRAFASIPLSDAFRRLPTSTHALIGFSIVVLHSDVRVEADPVYFIRKLRTGNHLGQATLRGLEISGVLRNGEYYRGTRAPIRHLSMPDVKFCQENNGLAGLFDYVSAESGVVVPTRSLPV